jgi:hypothetical protein
LQPGNTAEVDEWPWIGRTSNDENPLRISYPVRECCFTVMGDSKIPFFELSA